MIKFACHLRQNLACAKKKLIIFDFLKITHTALYLASKTYGLKFKFNSSHLALRTAKF